MDLPDFMEGLLSSGVRVGEILAALGTDVEPKTSTVAITRRVVRVPAKGLVRRRRRPGNVEGLLLALPQWFLPTWQRRKNAAGRGQAAVRFTGEYLDRSNVINRIVEAMEAVGYGWVTSHVFRKTVGTALDEANLPITAIADQFGNSRAVAERHYPKQRVADQANAAALENMMRAAVDYRVS